MATSYVTYSLTSWHFKNFKIFHKNLIGTQALLAVILHRSTRWIKEEILVGVISRNCKQGTNHLNTRKYIEILFETQLFFHVIKILCQIMFFPGTYRILVEDLEILKCHWVQPQVRRKETNFLFIKYNHIMTKYHHIIIKYHHIMTKYHQIITKYHHIMKQYHPIITNAIIKSRSIIIL